MPAFSFLAPCSGRMRESSHHPSHLVRSHWLGYTTCIDISGNQVLAPSTAKVDYISPAGNFIHLVSPQQGRIMLLLGAQELAIKLPALQPHVRTGDTVEQGTALLSVNQTQLRQQANAFNLMAVILQPNAEFDKLALRTSGAVTALESELVIQKEVA